MDLIATLLATPIVGFLVMTPVVAVGVAQRYLGPDADVVEGIRHRWWLRAQEFVTLLGGYTTAHSRPEEYVCSVAVSEDRLERHLWRQGLHRNLAAAKKYRYLRGSRQWASASWVYRDRFLAPRQLHVTLFDRQDGDVDCYVHQEPSNLTHPLAHWRGKDQVLGDPDETFVDALADAGVDAYRDGMLGAPERDRTIRGLDDSRGYTR